MSRPYGSVNKKHKANKLGKGKKKWKVWKKKEYKESARAKYLREELEKHPPTNARVFKLLGYCPKCGMVVGKADLEKGKKNIVICPCGNRCSVNKLGKGVSKPEDKPRSKREFLEDCIDIVESTSKITEPIDPPSEIGKMDTEEW